MDPNKTKDELSATRGGGNRRLLLVGFEEEYAASVATSFPARIQVNIVKKDDTLTQLLVTGANVVVVWVESNEGLLSRIVAIARDMTLPLPIIATGPTESLEMVRGQYSEIRVLESPLNIPYILGLLDSALMNREKVRSFGEQHDRVQTLYEVSSELLKVTNRKDIAAALDKTLPRLLPSIMTLISLPDDPSPLVYFRTKEVLTIPQVEILYTHVYGAWEVLRPSRKNSWDWLFDLAHPESEGSGKIFAEKCFVSAPITHERKTMGFITILPATPGNFPEAQLQSLFVLGDLLSVLLNNIHLREQLVARATHDGLTGLWNRQTLFDHLEREISRSVRYDSPVSVIMMDLDFFKKVNDTYGHQAGDEVLKYVSRKLQRSLRKSDFAGRCGGEEFIIVLGGTSMEGAATWAERFRRRLAATPLQWGKEAIEITASFGVSTDQGKDAKVDSVVARADKALYQAKREGRNRVSALTFDHETPIPVTNFE